MTVAEIREQIEIVLGAVDFDETKLVAYAEEVHHGLKRAMPDALIDCFNRIRVFVVQVRLGGRAVEYTVPLV